MGGCGSGTSGVVNVTITRSHLVLSRTIHKADTFPMKVDNVSGAAHKLVVVAADRPIQDIKFLPTGLADLSTFKVIDSLPTIQPGRYRSDLANIQPGRYYLLCTLAGPDGRSYVSQGLYVRFSITFNPDLRT
jgi:hypothetical protein